MELEMKFRCENLDTIEDLLVIGGFVKSKQKHQRDTYFIVNQHNEDGTRDYFRVRRDLIKGTYSMDYHRVLSELETQETEVDIEDDQGAIDILKNLGYEVKCVVDKKRSEYTKENLSVTLDEVKDLGTYVEIELMGDLNAENEQTILKTQEYLNLPDTNRVQRMGYPDLLLK